MKKLIAILLLTAMTFSVTACGGKSPTAPSGTESPESGTESAMEALPEDASLAQTVIADLTDKINSGDFSSLEDLANAINEAEYMPFAGATMPVEPGYLNGFTEEITDFKEGQMFGPAIGSIPFIGYIFTLEDSKQADAFLSNLKDKADLRWNICTEADEMQDAVVGDKVCFVMSPISFEE